MFGPLFPPSGWRAVALSVSPPPDNLVKTITMKCGDLDSPALLSPTRRRRIRNHNKRRIRRQLRHDPNSLLVREWLLNWRQELENEGYGGDPARIGKFRDAQDEISKRFQDSIQSGDLPEELAPTVRESPDVINLLWELALHGGTTLSHAEVRSNSPVWALLDLDPKQLKSLPPKEVLLLLLSRLKSLFGAPPAKFMVLKMIRWLGRAYLPSEEEPERKPEVLEKAIEAGLIYRAIKTRDQETGEVKVDVQDPRANDFIHEVEASGNMDSDAERREALFRLLASKGIAYDDLTPGDWKEIFEKYDLFLKGYELSSKTGVDISSFYGAGAHAKEQKWSRVKKKIRKVPKPK
jgi:hypothetical protein